MYRRIIDYLNKNNLLYEKQYGFRAGHSCEHALIDAHHTITESLGKKETSLLLLIDFSKAFDMVDHELMLQKLYYYGIRGIAHDWFRSYLSHRKQYVKINGSVSSIREIEHGVPQGSILGPLLFILFINDMPNIFPGAQFILYADDANIIIKGKTIKEIEDKINLLMRKLANWVQLNLLKLNTTKTKYMLISNVIKSDFNIFINGNKIERVTHDRFLGVMIDEKLSFAIHRHALAKKIANNCGVLFRARHVLNKESLNKLYFSFIQSHMVYCSNVWGLGSKNSLQNIFVSQKRAIRTMTFTKLYKKDATTGNYTYGHTKNIFKTYGFLCIHNLILAQALNLVHKIKLGTVPKPISTLLNFSNTTESCPNNNLNNTQRNRLARLDMHNTNIITHVDSNINIVAECNVRLQIQNHTFPVLGPKIYNHYVSKANASGSNLLGNTSKPMKHENLFLNGFKNRMKLFILELQSGGSEIHWEPNNFLLYNISNRNVVLRSDTLL